MITSLQNDKVKSVRALQTRQRVRQRERRFVCEGVRLVEEAVRAGVPFEYVFHTEGLEMDDGRGRALLAALRESRVPCYLVEDGVMDACSDTETPQGILAVLPMPVLPQPEHPSLTLVLDGVRDPGNLGTILRTALAAGVERVLLPPGTVDAYNPKVVRGAMGAHLRLPLVVAAWDHVAERIAGSDVWLADAGGETLHTAVDWTRPATLVMGGEAAGAGSRSRAWARGRVAIPMAPGVESLNVAAATAVILFEIVRQRRAKEGGAA
ncbi:MAG TPA: RNA methyltransferase [Chloroflexi bacterium]|nr:RNA methyltransferase [Chloroflexota bacterium]